MALWISIAIVTLVAIALVVWPLVSTRRPGTDARHDDERRLAVFRDRRREIDREREAGRLTAAEAEQAHADLVRQLAEDLPEIAGAGPAPSAGSGSQAKASGACAASAARTAAPASRARSRSSTAATTAAPSPRTAWVTAVLVALVVPLVAIGVYREVGAPHLASVDASGGQPPIDAAQVEAMIDRVEQRTREQPDDAEAWAMLAEARKMQGRHDEAVVAFAKAIEGIPNDPRLLTDYAESAALRAGGDFSGQPVELLERALAIDPNEAKAVALMGAAQYRLGNLPQARSYLKQLESLLAPGSEEASHIAAILQRIDEEIAAGAPAESATAQSSGPAAPSAPSASAPMASAPSASAPSTSAPAASQPPAPSTPPVASAAGSVASVAGTIALDPSLAERASAGGTLFVIARASGGPPVPIAVLRLPAPDFPVSFTLDDSNAMDPSRRLSGADSIELEARLSRSGEAMRRPGDLYGRVENVRPGTGGLRIVLDQVVPR